MDSLIQAFSSAAPVWEQALLQLTWYHGVIAAAYLGAAWLCLLNGHITRISHEQHTLWYAAAAALCLLAVNTVLHADVFVTQVLRELAKSEGWYGERRLLQALTMVAMMLVLLLSVNSLHARFAADDAPSEPALIGMAALLLLLALRTVSAHVTDAALNFRMVGASVGRLVEFAALALVIHGTLRSLRLR